MSERKYLKDVLPRLYAETVQWLTSTDRPELVAQMPHLFLTGRCTCGHCSDFSMDSDIPKLSRANGSTLLQRPLYYDMDNGFMLGLSGEEGLTEGEHAESYVSSFEFMGGDYEDGYINSQLEAHGWPRSVAPRN